MRSEVQKIRDGIEQLREVNNEENDRQADAIERLLNDSLARQAKPGRPDDGPRLAPADGDLTLVYGSLLDPDKVRWNVERCESAGLHAAAEVVRLLDRRNAALLREVERLANLLSVNVADMMTGENAVLRRQVEQLQGALETAEQQYQESLTTNRQENERLREKLERTRQRGNEAFGAWGAAEVRLVAEARRAQELEAEVQRLRSTWAPPQDEEPVEELIHCSRVNCVGHPVGCNEVC